MAVKTVSPRKAMNRAVLAREDDGTIQLTITITKEEVQKAEEEVLTDLSKTVQIPGFRPGNAPLEEVKKHVSAQTVLERLMSKILPPAYQSAITQHSLKLILSPKFELLGTKEGEDWQVRAITCEAPSIDIGEYKKEIEAAGRAQGLWVPGKDSTKGERTSEEKEQVVISTLLASVKSTIPKPLIEEEVNHRLAALVDQTQKLGLTVDQYLMQTGKTAQSLRQEYESQAKEQIKLMLALSKIGEAEGIKVTDVEIDKARNNQNGEKKELSSLEREVIRGALLRRRSLDRLVSFV